MARCFVTRDLPGSALDRLRRAHEVEVWSGPGPPPRGELVARAGEAEGLLSMLTDRIDADLLDAAPSLRAVSNYAVGWDNVAVAEATRRGIAVGNTPDVLTEATADLAWALMLAGARRVVEGHDAVRSGGWTTWTPDWLLGRDVHGATLLIVGRGRIGSAVARRAAGFATEVLTWGRSSGEALEEMLPRADFVSLHCPLTPETRGLIGERALAAMKPTALLVNTARGPVVDTAALDRALRAGRIGGAALDVTDPEPLPSDHSLLGAPNLTVLPHLGSATHAAREAMADRAVENLLASLTGERMPSCVNPEVYG